MLNFRTIYKPSDVNLFFEKFQADSESWIVSDLRSKIELQNQIIEKQGYALEHSILRVSDLWKQILKKTSPELSLVSSEIAQIKIHKFFQQNKNLNFDENLISSLMIAIDQLCSLCINPENDEKVEQWFSENPTASIRWKSWYLYARVSLRYLLSQNLILPGWIPAHLQMKDFQEKIFSKHLYFDLAGEIGTSEIDLIKKISQVSDVTVFVPTCLDEKYKNLLRPYELLMGFATQVSKSEKINASNSIASVNRYSTQLAEVKAIANEVFHLLNQKKLQMNEIAIVAPDIEDYWPSLSTFFEEEGIPVQKNTMIHLQSLPQIQSWLSRLRIVKEQWQKADLETTYYTIFSEPKMDYSRFKALYTNIYEQDDLKRNQEFFENLYVESDRKNKDLKRDEFIFKCLMYWGKNDSTEALMTLLKFFVESTHEDFCFEFNEWMIYLESIIAKKELLIKEGLAKAVHVTALMSADIKGLKKRFIIGLDEEALKTVRKSPLYNSDLMKLSSDTGLSIEPLEMNFKEFELDWILTEPDVENYLSFALTDFQGNILAPASKILRFEKNHDLTTPDLTRIDMIQRTSLNEGFRRIKNSEQIQKNLKRDKDSELCSFDSGIQVALSASTIEKYMECPFIVAAEKIFKLKDEPEVDLQVDPMTRGQIIHELFHRILSATKQDSLEKIQVDLIVEQVYKDLKPKIASQSYWLQYRTKLLKICQRFVNFEIEWRRQFPETQTVGTEVPFLFYFEPKNGVITKTKTDGSLKISGKIDRIDKGMENNFVIIDYKSSSAGLNSHPQWIKNHQLQLLMYMWCLEKELIENYSGEVTGAFYYVFKDFQRDKGLLIEEDAGNLFPSAGRKHSKILREEKVSLVMQFEELLKEVSIKILDGNFPPIPKDIKNCFQCEWRQVCRASHLA